MSQQFTQSPTNCSHPANDLIEAVAFGFATEEERDLVYDHVAECDECAAALRTAQFAAEALPLSAPMPAINNHESIWSGIDAHIASDSTVVQQEKTAETTLASPASTTRPSFRVHWAIAAMLAILALAGGMFLGQALFDSERSDERLVAQVEITEPGISATGTVQYDQELGVLVLRMDDMPAAPEGFVYQVWVISGDTPVSVGTMDPNSSEFATSRNPADFQTLAITIEDGPIGSNQPTTKPVAVADLTQLIDD